MAHRETSVSKSRVAALLAAAFLSACAGDGTPHQNPPPGGGPGGGEGPAPTPDPMPMSAKATVKPKDGARLLADLAQVLELEQSELCTEIGGQPCGAVHAIALFGTDAYQSGVYQPIEASIATSPIAVERIVLSACHQRALRDLDEPSAARLFVGVTVAADGTLDVDAAPVAEAVAELYRRGLLREPKAHERERVLGLHQALVEGGSEEPARDWATLSCFAVLTTMEFLFY
jgi:hypothetical protein